MCSPYMDEAKNTIVEELVSKSAFEAVEKLCRVCFLLLVYMAMLMTYKCHLNDQI